jgi:hypothetical protein
MAGRQPAAAQKIEWAGELDDYQATNLEYSLLGPSRFSEKSDRYSL